MATSRRIEIRVDQTGNALQGLQGIAGGASKVGLLAAGAAVTGLAALGSAAAVAGGFLVHLGSDAEEMQGKFDVVFSKTGAQVTAELDRFGNAVGRNRFELMGYASTLGDTLKPMGFTEEAAAQLAVQMTELGVDLSSFNNMSMDEALQRLQGTLIGSHENALAFGVIINENTLKQELMAMGAENLTGAQLEQAKVQARINLLMKGTTDAQGDAARTSGSWANQMKALQGELAEAATVMGTELLPIVTPLLKDFTTWIKEIMPPAVVIFKQFAADLKASAGPAMLMINDAVDRIAKAFGFQTGQVKLSDVALKAFKAILDSLVTALKLAAITMQGVALAVEKVSQAIKIAKGLADQFGTIVKRSMDRAKGALNSVIGKWNDFKNAVKSAVDAIPSWLIPHSPTPFEMGLRGIAQAAGNVADNLIPAFSVPNQGAGMLAPAGGSAPIVVQFTYSPMISTASRLEAEDTLRPIIEQVIRKVRGS